MKIQGAWAKNVQKMFLKCEIWDAEANRGKNYICDFVDSTRTQALCVSFVQIAQRIKVNVCVRQSLKVNDNSELWGHIETIQTPNLRFKKSL